ncbi:hypothetical protein H4R18_000560 [Coemansia javaensis]|uniref:Uncharacterized protein n=1 Tax=Coemansia javaensis TaxID=2761396 RepID=A0A9W8HFM8_9FUNG|nr:hypothetical protein H4R18_000560 [Coemansia javaensis]
MSTHNDNNNSHPGAPHHQRWDRVHVYDRGTVMYNGAPHQCFKYGSYTVYVRGRKMILFKRVYDPNLGAYVTRPPMEAWIRATPDGCHLDVFRCT